MEIREICEDEAVAKAKYGSAMGKAIQSRVADLDAAFWVSEILAGQPGPLDTNDPKGRYKIDLISRYRLVFCSNHTVTPKVNDVIAWDKVSHIQLLQIEQTHE